MDISNSRVTSFAERERLSDFVRRACACFTANPSFYSFGGEESNDHLLAIRWGLAMQAVLVLKLDEVWEPVIFGDCLEDGSDRLSQLQKYARELTAFLDYALYGLPEGDQIRCRELLAKSVALGVEP